MGEIEMRQEVPMWAALKLPEHKDSDGTKEYLPKKSRKHLVEPERVRLDVMAFMKRRGIALILIAAFAIYGWTVYAVTKREVTKDVTAEVETRMRAGFAQYLRDQDYQNSAANFLTGDASREAAIADLADCFDELIATYAMDYNVNEQGLNTLGWVFIARAIKASSEFGRSPQEIISKSGAWEGQVVGHAVRNQDTQIAMQIARDYLNGNYPDDFTPDMTFGDREKNGGFVARNEFITGPNTVYWRYKG